MDIKKRDELFENMQSIRFELNILEEREIELSGKNEYDFSLEKEIIEMTEKYIEARKDFLAFANPSEYKDGNIEK